MTKNIFYYKINRHQLIVVSTRLINVLQHQGSNLKEQPKILVWIAISEKGISKPFFLKTETSC